MYPTTGNLLNAVSAVDIQTGSALNTKYAEMLAAMVKWVADADIAAFTFATSDVNTGTEEITETAHGLVTDQIGRFTTSGTLPAGLALATNYYIIKVDADTFKVSLTRGGAAVNITDVGTGTHTFTPTVFGGTLKLQATVKDIDLPPVAGDWVDLPSGSVTVPGSGAPLVIEELQHPYAAIRAVWTPTGGTGTITVDLHGKAAGSP